MKLYFKIDGMVCGHCETAVENAAKEAGALKAKASRSKGLLEVWTGEGFSSDFAKGKIESAGYVVRGVSDSPEKPSDKKMRLSTFLFIVVFSIIALMIIKNTVGFNFIPAIPEGASYLVVFVVGAFTSLHCIVMCGGINLSQSLRHENSKLKGVMFSLLYNSGRIVSYVVIGAAAGAAGAALNFSPDVRSVIMNIAAVFMVFMGLRIAGFLSFIRLPAFLSQSCSRFSGYSPFVVGLLNGLIPCGPLQAAQIYALSTGSAAAGALSMLIFGAGTFPLMFALGAFGGFFSRRFTGAMYKAGGALVIVMAFMMFINSSRLAGRPITGNSANSSVSSVSDNYQTVISYVGASDYSSVIVQKNIPVRLIFRVSPGNLNGCNNAIVIPDLGIEKRLSVGDNIVEFTPVKTGDINFTCWMGMIPGKITVVENINDAAAIPQPEGKQPSGRTCCGGSGEFREYKK